MKDWKPIFIPNSRVPVWLSKFAPIEISALSFGPFVWGRDEIEERIRVHETIHFQQQLELLFVFQWVLYAAFWLIGVIKYRDAKQAYYNNMFEREAYAHDKFSSYLRIRPRYNWMRYR